MKLKVLGLSDIDKDSDQEAKECTDPLHLPYLNTLVSLRSKARHNIVLGIYN